MFVDKVELQKTARGVFKIESFDENDTLIDEYTDNNLIVYTAREIMAAKIADLDGHELETAAINRFVIGTLGHKAGNLVSPVLEGETGDTGTEFTPSITKLFSEEGNKYNYHVTFDPKGELVVSNENLPGQMFEGEILVYDTDIPKNEVVRTVRSSDSANVDILNVVEYKITIPVSSANIALDPVPYTEAALYAGNRLFAMKTFPARIKETTVKFVVTWSIIF